MADSGDSGCGCLIWFDLIWKIISNRQIKKINELKRNVQKISKIPTAALFPPESCKDNIIVSGGGQNERLYLYRQILFNAQYVRRPVIILHTSNGALERTIAANQLGTVISERNKQFDAFASFELNDIVHIVTDTYKSKYDIKPAARYVLQAAYDLLRNNGKNASFNGFATCPYFQLNDIINKRLNKGSIPQDMADKLISLLLTGQMEIPKIEAFFSDMKSQIDYLSAPNPAVSGTVSILSAIYNKRTLCIDIRSSSNVMLLELIINSLIIAMNRGLSFSLLIDDISFTGNDFLMNVLARKPKHNNIFFSNDLYSLIGGKDEIFSTITGYTDRTVLFAHTSDNSCKKWSAYLGEYDKIDVSHTSNSALTDKWTYVSASGQTEVIKREHKVKPEQIGRLPRNGLFFFNKDDGCIIQTIIESDGEL